MVGSFAVLLPAVMSSGALTVAELVPLGAVAARSTTRLMGWESAPLAMVVVLVQLREPQVQPVPLSECCENPVGRPAVTVMVSPVSVAAGPALWTLMV